MRMILWRLRGRFGILGRGVVGRGIEGVGEEGWEVVVSVDVSFLMISAQSIEQAYILRREELNIFTPAFSKPALQHQALQHSSPSSNPPSQPLLLPQLSPSPNPSLRHRQVH